MCQGPVLSHLRQYWFSNVLVFIQRNLLLPVFIVRYVIKNTRPMSSHSSLYFLTYCALVALNYFYNTRKRCFIYLFSSTSCVDILMSMQKQWVLNYPTAHQQSGPVFFMTRLRIFCFRNIYLTKISLKQTT